VQAKLAEQAPRERGTPVTRDIHLLNGLLFDETGDRLSPIHATKAGKRYRYYISSRLKETGSERKDGWRLPAAEIEAVVLQQFTTLLADKVRLAGWIEQVGQSARIEVGLDEADRMSDRLRAPTRRRQNWVRSLRDGSTHRPRRPSHSYSDRCCQLDLLADGERNGRRRRCGHILAFRSVVTREQSRERKRDQNNE
jgi:hypothetical protein